MAGFLKRLFGGGSGTPTPDSAETEEYLGFVIAATPIPESGQFRLSGVITKEIDGELREHKFIRADVFASKEQAEEFAMLKGKQMIDQLGERIFNQ